MSEAQKLTPVCAYDVRADGTAVEVTDDWPGVVCAPGFSYRWVHCDISDEALPDWLSEHLEPVPVAALLQSETRPRCDQFHGGVLLNLRGVNMNPGQTADDMVSLRLWIVKDLIISARIRKVWAVDAIRQQVSANDGPGTAGAFLCRLTQNLTDRIEAVSLQMEEATDNHEDAALESEHTAGTTTELAQLRRSAAKIRRYMGPQRDALSRLYTLDTDILTEANAVDLRETANLTMRAVEELHTVSERLASLQEHLDAKHNQAIGRNGYVLSIVAAIFLPLGFLTGLFGVNVAGMPGVDWPNAFAALSVISAGIGIALYLVFRWMKWL